MSVLNRLNDTNELQAAYKRKVKNALAQTLVNTTANLQAANVSEAYTIFDPVTEDTFKYAATFCKLLQHETDADSSRYGLLATSGESAYEQFRDAAASGSVAAWNTIPKASGNLRPFINPFCGYAFATDGCDSSVMSIPAPFGVTSAQMAAEMVEVYWQVLLRDVPFDSYSAGAGPISILVASAVADLNGLGANFTGPRPVTAGNLFRFPGTGPLTGPYMSQFMMQPLKPLIPAGCAGITAALIGADNIPASVADTPQYFPLQSSPANGGHEYGQTRARYVAIQNGTIPETYQSVDFKSQRAHIGDGRDLGSFDHQDAPADPWNAAINILISRGFPLNPNSPYRNGQVVGMAAGPVFGGPDAYELVGIASVEALKCAWAQKWRAYRSLRPENFAYLVDMQMRQIAAPPNTLPNPNLSALVTSSTVVNQISNYNLAAGGDQAPLLPGMYPEMCPAHPGYTSGHATISGACATVIKAIFDDQATYASKETPVVIDPSDARSLLPYAGAGANTMTVGGELDKLAANIAMGRDFAGVHFRSDGYQGVLLGERVALRILQDHARLYAEPAFQGYLLTKFDGTRVLVTPDAIVPQP